MSDYKPITGELRKYATVSWDPWPDARDRLYQMCDRIDAIHAGLERENAELKAELDRVTEKVLTYEEAKQMCMKAFDGGATYGSESMRYNVNAVAYDWEHWLKENERLFKPKPTIEDVLHEFVGNALCVSDVVGEDELVTEYAAKVREVMGE